MKGNCFSEFFNSICSYFKENGQVEKVSGEFAKISSDKERFKFVKNLAGEYNFYPSCLYDKFPVKCAEESVRLRDEGNKAFVKGKESKALKYYCGSVLMAPSSSELRLAYGNRSAVLLSLGHLNDALLDIDRALRLNYPDDLKYKLIKRKGDCLFKLGNLTSATQCYEDALSYLKASTLSEKKQKELEEMIISSLDRCLNRHESNNIQETVIECIPSIENCRNVEVLCAADSIKIQYSEEFGRNVVATKNIIPGDIIAIEDPFASILLPEFYATHCYHCLKRCWSLIPCEKCCHVMFCSEDCLRNAWQSYHKSECPALYYILKLELGKMALLALRIVVSLDFSSIRTLVDSIRLNRYSSSQREKGFSENGKYSSTDYSAIYHLEGHSDKRYVSDLFKRTFMSFCIMACLKDKTSVFSSDFITDSHGVEDLVGELILRHLQNLPCNAHEVSELFFEKKKPVIDDAEKHQPGLSSSLVEIGAAAYSFLSLINHSCDPNVVRHSYKGRTAILRAIKPVLKGEQIYDNYGYHYAVHSINVRHENLKNQYFFDCKCLPCTEGWPCYQFLKDGNINQNLRCQNCKNGSLKFENLRKSTDSSFNFTGAYFCKSCNKSVNVNDILGKLSISAEVFKSELSNVILGETVDKTIIINHLLLLDKFVIKPWKEFNDCQEALKHCYAMEGNCFRL